MGANEGHNAMEVLAQLGFSEIARILCPVIWPSANQPAQMLNFISLLTIAPEEQIGTEPATPGKSVIAPEQLVSEETARKMLSSERFLSKKTARTIYQRFDERQFVRRLISLPVTEKQLIVQGLGQSGIETTAEQMPCACYRLVITALETKIGIPQNQRIPQHKARMQVVAERYRDSIIAQSSGECIRCGKPLFSYMDSESSFIGEVLPIDPDSETMKPEDFATFCKNCAAAYSKTRPSPQAIERIRRKRLQESHQFEDLAMGGYLTDKTVTDIQKLLQDLKDSPINTSAPTVTSGYHAHPIKEKIPDNTLLRTQCITLMSAYFSVVQGLMKELNKNRQVSFLNLQHRIRERYELLEAEDKSQDEIFSALTHWLTRSTGSQYETASRCIVAYFVQICEVFRVAA